MTVDFYPMPSFPVLEVRDAAASGEWYQRVLGFQHVFTIPGPNGTPVLVHLRWAKYADLLLRQERAAGAAVKGVGVALNFALLEGGVDALAERARNEGAKLLSEPKDQPWNARDFSVKDPDGFALTFTEGPVKKGLELEAVLAKAREGATGISG